MHDSYIHIYSLLFSFVFFYSNGGHEYVAEQLFRWRFWNTNTCCHSFLSFVCYELIVWAKWKLYNVQDVIMDPQTLLSFIFQESRKMTGGLVGVKSLPHHPDVPLNNPSQVSMWLRVDSFCVHVCAWFVWQVTNNTYECCFKTATHKRVLSWAKYHRGSFLSHIKNL